MPRGVDRLDQARIEGRLWTPMQWMGTPRLRLWYDAISRPMLDLGGTATWPDLSGNGTDASVTATARPALQENSWNSATRSLRAIKPDGSNDTMFFTSFTYNASVGQSVHAAVHNSGAASYRTIISNQVFTGTLQLRFSNTNKLEYLRNNLAVLITSTNTISTGFHLMGCDAQTNLSRIWIDGASEQNATDPAFTNSFGNLFTNQGGGNEPFDSFAGEYVVANQMLTLRETALVTGYLAWKWGTVDKLPANHAFLRRPPLIGD